MKTWAMKIFTFPEEHKRTKEEVLKDKQLMQEINAVRHEIDLEMGDIPDFPVDNLGRKYFPYERKYWSSDSD